MYLVSHLLLACLFHHPHLSCITAIICINNSHIQNVFMEVSRLIVDTLI